MLLFLSKKDKFVIQHRANMSQTQTLSIFMLHHCHLVGTRYFTPVVHCTFALIAYRNHRSSHLAGPFLHSAHSAYLHVCGAFRCWTDAVCQRWRPFIQQRRPPRLSSAGRDRSRRVRAGHPVPLCQQPAAAAWPSWKTEYRPHTDHRQTTHRPQTAVDYRQLTVRYLP